MAKRVILSFTENPTAGVGFNIGIQINDISINYDNGEIYLTVNYLTNGNPDVIPFDCELQTNLSDTIDKTLAFLKSNWTANFISYSRVDDTIVMLIQSDDLSIYIGAKSTSINITIQDVDDSENLNLKYFFQYTNHVGDTFLCQIFKKYYLGSSTEINGTATLEKAGVKSHTDSIKGTGLAIDLEASTDLTLEDLYSDNEQDFTVKFYRNGVVMFRGYLKPDGVFQSFTEDSWIISLDCVDGLGALSNLSFVNDNGFRFTGRMKAIDIIYYCLKRTGILMPVNTSINILYNGLTPANDLDILTKIYLNADRFFKEDAQSTGDGTLMSCEEVLKSILDIFRACITQANGQWYIYKPNEIYVNPYVVFRQYNISNVYTGYTTINLNKSLGSQINNFYPHHSARNQKIEISGGISAFRLGYKYGFAEGLITNNLFKHTGNDFDNWTENSLVGWINDPIKTTAFKVAPRDRLGSTPRTKMLTSNLISLAAGDLIKVSISYNAQSGGLNPHYALFKVRLGSYYLNKTGQWGSSDSIIILKIEQTGSRGYFDFTISADELPISGNVYAEIYRPEKDNNTYASYPVEITDFNIVPNVEATSGHQGEFHTVSRNNKVSSLIKDNLTVYNGDSTGLVYTGVIMKEDSVTPTDLWSRAGTFENYPLLRIAAEEELRIAQKPLKVFSGDVEGYIPFLSLIDIDGVGKFMPIEYSYDTSMNKLTIKHLELFSPEISDILYKFTFDYGNTVKPTIIG